MTNHFPKSHRLLNREQFQKVFAARCSAADHAIILFALPNGLPHCRLGLSVSKKIGNAAVRNRWKRLLREAFRQCQHTISGNFDLVVVPQRNADVRTVKNLQQSLKYLTAKIASRTENKRPTVLLTRPAHQTESMKTKLESLGFRVLLQPAIDILPPESWQETDDVLQKLQQNEFDWLIFSSSNGIHAFFDRLEGKLTEPQVKAATGRLQIDSVLRDLPAKGIPNIPIAVVGSGTDLALYERIGRHADVIPQAFTAEGLAEALLPETEKGKRFLHLRASRGRDVLKRLLTESGGSVTEVAVYRSIDRTQADPKIAELLRQGKIDSITVTSSAIARSLVNLFGELLHRTRLVSISPITTQTLCDLGFSPASEAEEASLAGIFACLAAGSHG
ncbi:MAG: ribonuclease P protein component [Planctomycetaceae bacterium]|nr:ribonuclease P protein component [Planctomycetaceae bacterium]